MKKLFFLLALLTGSVNLLAQGLCGTCRLPLPAMADKLQWEKTVEATDLDDWNPTYTIDFMCAFDPPGRDWALEHCGSLEAYAEHVVKSMNTVMHNSELDGKFRLVGTYVTSAIVPEVVKGCSMAFNDVALRAAVKEVQADITILFVAAKGSTSGVSGNAPYLAQPGDGYACVHVEGGYNNLTAIHEAAHIMGCNHSRDVDLDDVHPYAYGAMRWIDGNQYSTVMGYHGTILPHFSSPNYIYKGTAMGSETENNVRRISERLPEVARLGDPRTNYELGQTEWRPSAAEQQTQVSLSGRKAYRILSDQPGWLSVTPTQGWLEEPFTISVKANTTGKARRGHITVEDWDATNPEYTGEILGSTTVTVTQANAAGDYTIDGEEQEDVRVASITLAPSNLSLKVGETATVTATILPADATNKNLNWSSSSEKVCTVSQGVITAIGEGKATIRVKAADGGGASAQMEVSVTKNGGEDQPDADEEYAVNFSKDLPATRTDRILSAVTLTEKGGEEQEISVTGATIYNDLTKQSFTVQPGATLTAGFQYSGSWMHGYIYVDERNDGRFDLSDAAVVGAPLADLKSYSFYSFSDESEDYGYNSAGSTLSGNAINVLMPPAFTAPAKVGQYRMRYKIDWNCIDPAGKYGPKYSGNYIDANGGYIVDVTLNVQKPDGIEAPSTSLKGESPVTYDLTGRMLLNGKESLVPGVRIVGGKKLIR